MFNKKIFILYKQPNRPRLGCSVKRTKDKKWKIEQCSGRPETEKNFVCSSATGFGPRQGEDDKSGGKQVQEWDTGHGQGEMLDWDLEESLGNHRFSG